MCLCVISWKFSGDTGEGIKSIPFQLQRLFIQLQVGSSARFHGTIIMNLVCILFVCRPLTRGPWRLLTSPRALAGTPVKVGWARMDSHASNVGVSGIE